MNGNLVDTNVIIKLLNGDERAVRIFDNAKNIFVPVIVAGELFYVTFFQNSAFLFCADMGY